MNTLNQLKPWNKEQGVVVVVVVVVGGGGGGGGGCAPRGSLKKKLEGGSPK